MVKVSLWLIAVMLVLSGCADSKGTSKINPVDGAIEHEVTGKGRYDAWSSVENKKSGTLKEIEKTRQKELDLEIAKANQVHVVLDSPEKINAWNNAQATRDLGEVAKNLSNGQAPSPYAEYFRPTPLPKSGFAEGVEAVGGAVARVAESPAGIATTVGYFVGAAARGASKSGDTTVDAGPGASVTVNQVKTKGQSSATISGRVQTAEQINAMEDSPKGIIKTLSGSSEAPEEPAPETPAAEEPATESKTDDVANEVVE